MKFRLSTCAAMLLLASIAAPVAALDPVSVTSSLKGNYVKWSRGTSRNDIQWSIYRGSEADSLELIGQGAQFTGKGDFTFLDRTAEPGQPYYYQVVGTSDVVRFQPPPVPGSLIYLRDFSNREVYGEPASSGEKPAMHDTDQSWEADGIRLGVTGKGKPVGFTRFLSDLREGRRYVVRMTYGRVDNWDGSGGTLRLSLSPERPVRDVVIDTRDLEANQHAYVDYEIPGGPNGWGSFGVTLKPNKSSKGADVYVRKVEVFELAD